MPFIKFPEDINVNPAEKIKIYDKPDDNRFKLTKQKKDSTPEIKRGDAALNNPDVTA